MDDSCALRMGKATLKEVVGSECMAGWVGQNC